MENSRMNNTTDNASAEPVGEEREPLLSTTETEQADGETEEKSSASVVTSYRGPVIKFGKHSAERSQEEDDESEKSIFEKLANIIFGEGFHLKSRDLIIAATLIVLVLLINTITLYVMNDKKSYETSPGVMQESASGSIPSANAAEKKEIVVETGGGIKLDQPQGGAAAAATETARVDEGKSIVVPLPIVENEEESRLPDTLPLPAPVNEKAKAPAAKVEKPGATPSGKLSTAADDSVSPAPPGIAVDPAKIRSATAGKADPSVDEDQLLEIMSKNQ